MSKITELEEWDFVSTFIKHEVWRTYLAAILNNIIYALIQAEVLIERGFLQSKDPISSFTESNKETIRFDCKEDMIAIAFVKLLITELIARYIFYLYWFIHQRLYGRIMQKSWKREFETSDELVWVLALQNILWFNIMFFPFCTVVSVIVIYLHFKFVMFRLQRWKIPPKESSNDASMGNFIMFFMNFTFLLNIISILFVLFIATDHTVYADDATKFCGPFEDGMEWYIAIEEMMQNGVVITWIWNWIITNRSFWAILIVFLFFRIMSNHK